MSPAKYTIQLLEGIHDNDRRQEIALEASKLLGTSAEQLEQLFARGQGARIARAGSERRAAHVAELLRSVGMSVEVVAPMGDASLDSEALPSNAVASDTTNTAPFSGNEVQDEVQLGSSGSEMPSPAANLTPSQGHSVDHGTVFAGAPQAQQSSDLGNADTDGTGSTWWLSNPNAAPNAAAASTTEAVEHPAGETQGVSPDPFSTFLPNDEGASGLAHNGSGIEADVDQQGFTPAPWLSAVVSTDLPVDLASQVDPFAPASGDLFATDAGDPFATGFSNPFAIGASNPFAASDFGNTGTHPADGFDAEPNPFASAIVENPFAEMGDTHRADDNSDLFELGDTDVPDPFVADANSPFAPASGHPTNNDPFAPALGQISAADPFAAAGNQAFAAAGNQAFAADPFSQASSLPAMVSSTSPNELPAQARDRNARRSSIQTKTLVALIVPILVVVASIVGIISWIVPQTVTSLLKARSVAMAAIQAESIRLDFDRPNVDPTKKVLLNGMVQLSLNNVPNAAWIIIFDESHNINAGSAISEVNRDTVLAALKPRLRALQNKDPNETLNQGDIIELNGVHYVTAARSFTNNALPGQLGGFVITGLVTKPINVALTNTLVPIFIAIGLTLVGALAVGIGLARSLMRPILVATQQANRIALGDLDRAVANSSNDEVGDLLTALEQMRVSLRSMVSRMRRDR